MFLRAGPSHTGVNNQHTTMISIAVRRSASALAVSRHLSSRSGRNNALSAIVHDALSSPALPPCSSQTSSFVANLGPHPNKFMIPRCFSSAVPKSDVKLYQYQICPFCNITKSLLAYTNLEYESVEVNPLTKAELKPWSGDYKKVPIAIIDGEQMNGSENILESILSKTDVQKTLEKLWNDEVKNDERDGMTIQQFKDSGNAQKWFRFASDDLSALLYPNICGSLGDSYDAFGYVKDVDTFSAVQKISIQSLGALAMYFAASKVKCELLRGKL